MKKIPRLVTAGFTIVELLIVIVVIATLATITIVGYNGIRERANAVSISSDLISNRKKLLEHKAVNGSYPLYVSGRIKDQPRCTDGTEPGQVASNYYCPILSNGVSPNFSVSLGNGETFKFVIGKGTKAYSIDQDGNINSVDCTVDNGQSPATGYSVVYYCPDGAIYSQ